MLPVITGFIFPSGEILDTAVKGHCTCARKYISEHNLQKEFLAYNGAEDDFLIERLGAMKLCQYLGKSYIYLPRNCSWYIKQVKKLYEDEGFISKDCYWQEKKIEINEQILINHGYSYNQTVVKTINPNGEMIYSYNPERKGD